MAALDKASSVPVTTPVPPVRQYSFTDWQVNNPTAPPPGDRMDAEYDRANASIAQVINWVEANVGLTTPPSDPGNFDSAAAGSAALAQDYADVTMAWAEHMPDTIPPNILAVMGVTGDHWSSRWWANQAVNIARNAGAFSGEAPPANPYPGQLWFDSKNPQLYVWYVDPTSAQWVIATGDLGSSGTTVPDGVFLPLTGGTVTGATTFITAGVGLALTDGVGIGSTRTNFFSPNGIVLDIRDPNVGPLANFVSITANKTGSNPIISVANAGDANTNLQLNAKGTGYLYLGSNVGMPARTITWAGDFATGQPLLTLNGLMGGVATGDAAAMWLAINDTIDARTGLVHGLNIIHNFGGILSVGSKTGLNVFLNQTSTTNSIGNITGQIEYAGAIISSRANANDGGTLVNGFGSITGVNIIANAQPGATYYGYLEGLEIDVSANAGSSPHNKLGLAISAAVGDADHGLKTDAGILIKAASSNPNTGGFMMGIMFGQQDGNFPVPLGGTLIGTQVISYNAAHGIGARSPNPAYGIDWSKVNFTSNSLLFPGFSVSGLGVTSVGAAVLTPTTTGASLDVALQQSSAPTVVVGGHDFVVGDIMFHPSGAQSRVASVDGAGAITALTQLVPGYSSSPPTGGQTLTGGNGQGGQASLTWTAATTLALQPSGGKITSGLLTNAANDAAAASAGVIVGQWYRNGSQLMQRVA